jgi:peptidyl-prolyl cis-trans isomerase SurA
MKNSMKNLILSATLLLANLNILQAAELQLDKVAAVINDGVVLESEVKDLLQTIKLQAKKNNQTLPRDSALRVQVMDKLIDDNLVLQIGERMGVQISDTQLDATLANMAKENTLSLDDFRQALVAEGVNYEKYRETVRNELILGEVKRGSVQRRIYVSPQEIANLLSVMKEQTNSNVEYNLGHILIEFPVDPTQEDINSAKTRAEKVIELLKSGRDFARIAIASSGGDNALQGGDLGWKNINEMPTLFSEIVDGEEAGSVLGPIRTGLGFSIVKVLEIRGKQTLEVEEVKARHILIQSSIILSEKKAEAMLQKLMDQILAGELDFADAAKEHSEGPTSVRGGDLGWADPANYDPTFANALASLEVDEIHKPFRSSFGWHLAQLTGRRVLDATQQMNENKARQILFQRKFSLESTRWLREIREEAYIAIMETP